MLSGLFMLLLFPHDTYNHTVVYTSHMVLHRDTALSSNTIGENEKKARSGRCLLSYYISLRPLNTIRSAH